MVRKDTMTIDAGGMLFLPGSHYRCQEHHHPCRNGHFYPSGEGIMLHRNAVATGSLKRYPPFYSAAVAFQVFA